jgi:hypothetical protein
MSREVEEARDAVIEAARAWLREGTVPTGRKLTKAEDALADAVVLYNRRRTRSVALSRSPVEPKGEAGAHFTQAQIDYIESMIGRALAPTKEALAAIPEWVALVESKLRALEAKNTIEVTDTPQPASHYTAPASEGQGAEEEAWSRCSIYSNEGAALALSWMSKGAFTRELRAAFERGREAGKAGS